MNLSSDQMKLKELLEQGKDDEEISIILGITKKAAHKRVKRLQNRVSSESEPQAVKEPDQFLLEQLKYYKALDRKNKKTNAFEEELLRKFDEHLSIARPEHNLRKIRHTHKNDDEELVLLIGDTHIGEIVNPEEVMGLNHYNVDVARTRVNRMYNAVEAIVDRVQGYENSKLNIFFLGDIVSGLIHDELMRGETPVAEQTVIAGYTFLELIEKWAARFPEVEVYGVVGNHGRLQKQVRHKKVYNNFDWIAYRFMELGCRGLDNVRFNLTKSKFARTEIFDWKFLLNHGDSKTPSYAGIPFYGIKRADTNMTQTLVAAEGWFPNYVCMGHIHSNNTLDRAGGAIYINGSMIGTSDYALNALSRGGSPKQTLLSVHRNLGVNCKYDLYLD